MGSADCVFTNITAIDFKTFIIADSSAQYNNLHAWLANKQLIIDSIFYKCEKALTGYFSQCFADSYETVFYAGDQNANVKVTLLTTYFNSHFWGDLPENINMYLFKQKDPDNFYYFARSSLQNSQIAGGSGVTMHLTNSVRSLLATIDLSNSFSNNTVPDANSLYNTEITELTKPFSNADINLVTCNNNITNINFHCDFDGSLLASNTPYRLGYIKNMRFAPNKIVTGYAIAYNTDTTDITILNVKIDYATLEDIYSGRIQLTPNNNYNGNKYNKLYMCVTVPNYKTNINSH